MEGLEGEFARFCGAEQAVAVGNGADALRFAPMSVGMGRNEETCFGISIRPTGSLQSRPKYLLN